MCFVSSFKHQTACLNVCNFTVFSKSIFHLWMWSLSAPPRSFHLSLYHPPALHNLLQQCLNVLCGQQVSCDTRSRQKGYLLWIECHDNKEFHFLHDYCTSMTLYRSGLDILQADSWCVLITKLWVLLSRTLGWKNTSFKDDRWPSRRHCANLHTGKSIASQQVSSHICHTLPFCFRSSN